MEIKDIKWTKWIAIGAGGLLGLSHLGMIGIIANKKPLSKFPQLNIPVNEYTSYEVEAGTDGYRIKYNANDPKLCTLKLYLVVDYSAKVKINCTRVYNGWCSSS